MFLVFRSLFWTVFLLLLSGTPAIAQSKAHVADSLKKVIADHRSRLHMADTLGDARGAVDLRLRLAEMVKPKEAVQLLQEAVAISDSTDLVAEEETALTRLAEFHERSGNHRQAYDAAMRLVGLGNGRLSAQAEESGSERERALAQTQAERDSAQRAWQERFDGMAERQRTTEAEVERWRWSAIGIGMLCLIVIAGLVFRSNKGQQRIRKELADVRAEILALRERPVNTLRAPPSPPAPPPPIPPAPDPVPVEPVTTSSEPLDPIVVAMFRKMGPERLAAIRAARQRGDHEKVVRVVHSLKPQLVNFDSDHFTALCARITAPGSHVGSLWASDLDALEKGIADVLKRLDH